MAFTPSFSCAHAVQTARADTPSGVLILRRAPCPTAEVAAKTVPGASVFVLRRCGSWFFVCSGAARGYACADDLVLCFPPRLSFFV